MKTIFDILSLVLVPFIVFFSIKFGTYAFYCGRRLFESELQERTKHDGEHKNEERKEVGVG